MPRPCLALCLTLVSACNARDAASTADAGTVDPDGGGSEACAEPDRDCPLDPPVSGGPCEGTLTCEYDDGTFAECTGGLWQSYGCIGCAPPLAEGCRAPFEGTLSGATVEIGPWSTGAFRPFAPGERSTPVFGAQGGAMVEYRVRLSHELPPGCVSISSTVSLDGTPAPATFPLRVHCGESLRVYAILPDTPCEFRDYEVTLTVDVEGVGSTEASLVMEGGGCPRELPG